jgi:hypothetical protein
MLKKFILNTNNRHRKIDEFHPLITIGKLTLEKVSDFTAINE